MLIFDKGRNKPGRPKKLKNRRGFRTGRDGGDGRELING
jgi:hypothetical protein